MELKEPHPQAVQSFKCTDPELLKKKKTLDLIDLLISYQKCFYKWKPGVRETQMHAIQYKTLSNSISTIENRDMELSLSFYQMCDDTVDDFWNELKNTVLGHENNLI